MQLFSILCDTRSKQMVFDIFSKIAPKIFFVKFFYFVKFSFWSDHLFKEDPFNHFLKNFKKILTKG